jgi:hypothetical protein
LYLKEKITRTTRRCLRVTRHQQRVLVPPLDDPVDPALQILAVHFAPIFESAVGRRKLPDTYLATFAEARLRLEVLRLPGSLSASRVWVSRPFGCDFQGRQR